ncbi:MAG: DoxX family protein [Burkholderiaceae bacterium]|jgi:uncharacterized membrane protein YphA (DoxX/SURF4 family)
MSAIQERARHELRGAIFNGLVERVLLTLLCSAYLLGALQKFSDLSAAAAEMEHFGLSPGLPMAVCVGALEGLGSVAVIAGIFRPLAAFGLGVFTFAASCLANKFWTLTGHDRFTAENGFFEHLGLAGSFFLVAWLDWRSGRTPRP